MADLVTVPVAQGSDVPALVGDARDNLVKLRRIVECIYDHHRDNTDDGRAIMLDVIEMHEWIGALETLMDEIEVSHGG